MKNNIFSMKIRQDKIIDTIKGAGWFGIFIAIVSPLIFFFFSSGYEVQIIDIIVIVISSLIYLSLGIGTLLKNKFAAYTLLVMYIIDTIYILVISAINGSSAVGGVIVRVFLAMILARGAKATKIYHKNSKIKK